MSLNNSHPFVILIAQPNHPDWLVNSANNSSGNIICVLADHKQDIVTKINSTGFNLIIIDETINAGEVISAIRKPKSLNQQTPSIALTGQTESVHKKHLISLGFDDCLPKPLMNDNLKELIEFWHGHEVQSGYLRSLQILLDNCRNNRKLAITIYEKLFDSLPQQIDMIEAALVNSDYRSALELTHKLNGAVKTCYLKPVEVVSDNLEKIFQQSQPELIDQQFLALKQSIGDFLQNRETIFEYLSKENQTQ